MTKQHKMASDTDQAHHRMLAMVASWLVQNMNNATDINNEIREPLQYVYPLFIVLHVLVGICGVTGNILVITNVVKNKLYMDPLHFFLSNLAVSDIIKALFAMPLTLTNLLIKHWVFGSFLCYFLPMLQSFPVYVSMITYLVIAIHRYRTIMYPMKSKIPAALSIIATWILSICIVLPQAIYLQYFDLGQISPKFSGLGICLVSLEKNYEEYVRAMFTVLYAAPLCAVAFLYIKVSAELKALYNDRVTNRTVEADPVSQALSETSYHSKLTHSTFEEARIESEGTSGNNSFRERIDISTDDSDLDVAKEKRTQKYMITMVVAYAICWLPLNILYIVMPFLVLEDTEQQMDITYITFSWIGFVSTCSTPVLYAWWYMSDNTRDRLRGYFQYPSRRSSTASGGVRISIRQHNSQRGLQSRMSDQRAFL